MCVYSSARAARETGSPVRGDPREPSARVAGGSRGPGARRTEEPGRSQSIDSPRVETGSLSSVSGSLLVQPRIDGEPVSPRIIDIADSLDD